MDMKIPIPKGHPGRALKFELIAKCSRSKARAANMTLPHGIARKAIIADKFPEYVHQFFSDLYAGDKTKYPQWAVDALRKVNIDLLE
ncbi:hypothetical protein D0Z03_000357 [Geotrichum reessii]|nr:hypothetical protein D0Z03_000357 [Galactomyces reessii]